MAKIFDPFDATRLMLDGYMSHIRGELRAKIKAAIENDIEDAITAAVEGLKVGLERHRDHLHLLEEIRITVERKEPKTADQPRLREVK